MLPNVTAELTPEQIEQLEQARKTIPALKAQLRKAKSAGIDVSAQEADLANLEAQLDKLYRVYVGRITTARST